MALTFNGTSSRLTRVGQLVSGYPFTIFLWTRATSTQAAFAVELAVEPGPLGTHEGHGIASISSSLLAWSTIGSGVGAYSAQTLAQGAWVPCMAVFTSDSLRKIYYGTGSVRTQSSTVAQTPAILNTLSIGSKAVTNVSYWAGDLACVGVWASELSAADFASLSGGASPLTVQSASLVDYWSLQSQSATQTGINGRVLAATNTAQAATHPITENSDTTAPSLTGSLSVSDLTGTGYTLSWPPGTDNVGVVTYERSLDGGASWVEVGNVRSTGVTGRTPGTTDQVRVRAKDAAGNVSTALSVAVTLPDTVAPAMAGTLQVSNVTSTGYNLSWPAATDNVGVTSYEVSVNGGATYSAVGLSLGATLTGRTPGATDQVRVRAKDAAGNASTPLSASVTLQSAGDGSAPVMSGTISVSNVTTTGYSLSWSAATDNIGVVAYEVSLNGGSTYSSVGNQLSTSIAGRTPGSTDQIRVRARDAAGNVSTPLSTTVNLLTGGDTTMPVMTGNIAAFAITTNNYQLSWPAATDNVGVTAYEVSVDGGATYVSVGLLLACYIGSRTPGTTDQVRVRARDAAGNISVPLSTSVTLLGQDDSTPPVLTGAITVTALTTTGYTLSWGAGSDNIGVSAYERSLDGGSNWVSVGNVLTVDVTGRTPGAIDQVRVRARDAAGNVSSPALSTSVTLPTGGAPTLVTPPMKNNTGTLLANLSGITVNVYDAGTGALVVRKTGLSSNAAGVVSISDAALVSGTAYAYEVVTPSSGRRLPTGTAA